MVSPFDRIHAIFGAPALNLHHGETVTKYPAGVVANALDVDDCHFSEQPPSEDLASGENNLRRATLTVPASTSPIENDRWLINAEEWETESIGDTTGERTLLNLKRNERQNRKRTSTVI